MIRKIEHALAKMLLAVNASPPLGWKQDFLDVKCSLLRKYGQADGQDWRYLPAKKCSACLGSGNAFSCCSACFGSKESPACPYCDGGGKIETTQGCDYCDGTGILRPERWIALPRTQLGGVVFYGVGPVRFTKPVAQREILVGHLSRRVQQGYKQRFLFLICLALLDLRPGLVVRLSHGFLLENSRSYGALCKRDRFSFFHD